MLNILDNRVYPNLYADTINTTTLDYIIISLYPVVV